MNRSKKLCILAGILLVACAVTFGVMRLEEHKEKISNSGETILALPADDVQALSWTCNSVDLAFHRDEGWVYDEDEAFPVSEEKMQELLGLFEDFSASFTIEDVEDYGQYGLDDPTCTINLDTEEESYEILLGGYSTMDSERYVSIGDGKVYLVSTDPLDYFDAGLSDMIDNDETPQFTDIETITFSGDENYTVVYEEDSPDTYCADDVYFARIGEESLPLSTDRVDSYLQAVSFLGLTDYVTYNATDEELAAYGLDEPEMTLSMDYTAEEEPEDTKTFVLNISRDPEERAALEENGEDNAGDDESEDDEEEEEITAYARVSDSRIVYQISADSYKSLMAASYDDLRHTEVLSAAFEDIQQIDISLEGEEYSIVTGKTGDTRSYMYQDEEVDIADFQAALEALSADSFTDEEPSDILEIGLTVHLDNEQYPEVLIELYRYDGTHCLAVVDGKPVSLVQRGDVVDLIEAVHAIVLN